MIARIKQFKDSNPNPNSWSKIKRCESNREIFNDIVEYLEINTNIKNADKLVVSELFFIIENGIKDRPVCPICAGFVKFFNMYGYRTCCCTSCSNKYSADDKQTSKRSNRAPRSKILKLIKIARSNISKKRKKARLLSKPDFQMYLHLVTHISNKTFSEFYYEINPLNLKRGREYHLDHIFSISEGFKQNIPIHIIASKYNLQMLYHSTNTSKNKTCWMTKEELFEKYFQS